MNLTEIKLLLGSGRSNMNHFSRSVFHMNRGRNIPGPVPFKSTHVHIPETVHRVHGMHHFSFLSPSSSPHLAFHFPLHLPSVVHRIIKVINHVHLVSPGTHINTRGHSNERLHTLTLQIPAGIREHPLVRKTHHSANLGIIDRLDVADHRNLMIRGDLDLKRHKLRSPRGAAHFVNDSMKRESRQFLDLVSHDHKLLVDVSQTVIYILRVEGQEIRPADLGREGVACSNQMEGGVGHNGGSREMAGWWERRVSPHAAGRDFDFYGLRLR